MQINQIFSQDPQYPQQLLEIPSPPKSLYVLGELPTAPMVAIVGTRKPSEYGQKVTYQLAYELAAAGMVIVSGLAAGLDAVAHRAALDAGGLTIAVQACGLDQIYPASNRQLAIDILDKGGAIISEYEAKTVPFRGNFPARNRIVSGLSIGTIVTEATADSGTLITANFATAQNRVVMAVPGNITSPRAAGPNNLLRTGGVVVTGASDVLAALNFETGAVADIPVLAKSPQEAKILALMREGVSSSQDLIEASGYPANEFANIISLMEITGKVRNLGAGVWTPR